MPVLWVHSSDSSGPDIQDDCADAWDMCAASWPQAWGAWEGGGTGSVGEPDVVAAGPA